MCKGNYWALIAERLYKCLVIDNEYFSKSVQKGSKQKVAGCWENTAMVCLALKVVGKRRRNMGRYLIS